MARLVKDDGIDELCAIISAIRGDERCWCRQWQVRVLQSMYYYTVLDTYRFLQVVDAQA
jgi:hypothetical protein